MWKSSSAYSSITRSISSGSITGRVLFNFGWKHITRQVPLASPIWNNGSSLDGGDGVFSRSAGKSFGNTNVDSYFGFTYMTHWNCWHTFLIDINWKFQSNLSVASLVAGTKGIIWVYQWFKKEFLFDFVSYLCEFIHNYTYHGLECCQSPLATLTGLTTVFVNDVDLPEKQNVRNK